MPLPGPNVGDYLKPIRDVFRREKFSMYGHYRTLTGVADPVVVVESEEV
jgi:hypothetical protein